MKGGGVVVVGEWATDTAGMTVGREIGRCYRQEAEQARTNSLSQIGSPENVHVSN